MIGRRYKWTQQREQRLERLDAELADLRGGS